MTRDQLQYTYPDTFAFFREMPDTHPFWQELLGVELLQVQAGRTLLADLEQVFAHLRRVDGHHVFIDRIANVETRDELMQVLTKLYVAYLYRDHGARLVHGDGEAHYDIEVTIADQLLAMGVVSFHSFASLTDQFSAVVHDEITHLKDEARAHEERVAVGNEDMPVRDADIVARQQAAHEPTPEEFLKDLETYSTGLPAHNSAHHAILTSVTPQEVLPQATRLHAHIAQSHEDLAKRFPMIAGVLLIDPRPGVEKASFVPFHVGSEYLEQLLDKGQ